MTPSELRELADALANGTHFVDSPELHAAMQSAADYLRACADAKPVAWMWQHDETGRIGFVDPWNVENGWQELNPRCRIIYPLYTHPAPAAPQAEPKREPLSNRRIGELWNQAWSIAGITDEFRMIEFVRLVERAHGIGGSDAGAD